MPDEDYEARLTAALRVSRNQLGNAVGAIIDSGGYCEGPHDVADAIYRLTAERDDLREVIGPPVTLADLKASIDARRAAKPEWWQHPSGRWRRLRACVDAWEACASFEYDPSCCRWPKSCSCDVYDPASVTEDDLEPRYGVSAVGGAPGVSETHTDPQEGQ